jgi:hypothetical protein
MRLLKKKRIKQADQTPLVKDKIATWIASCVVKLQMTFAKFMDKKINPLPIKRKRLILYAFCIISSIIYLQLILSPLVQKNMNKDLHVEAIRFPKHFDKSGESNEGRGMISKEEYERIRQFKLYMDSLANDAAGKSIYDSILKDHAGLMDSIGLLEEYYHFQK